MKLKFTKKNDPTHPYCTNWPMTDKEQDEIEMCVSCGAETSYKKGTNVTFRLGYIDGAGQLCLECSSATENIDIDYVGALCDQSVS